MVSKAFEFTELLWFCVICYGLLILMILLGIIMFNSADVIDSSLEDNKEREKRAKLLPKATLPDAPDTELIDNDIVEYRKDIFK